VDDGNQHASGEQPSAGDVAYLSQQFRDFNDRQSGVFPSRELHLFAYGTDREIIGGLAGDIS
jgi:hypothetical protein